MDSTTCVYGLIGDPLDHSISPQIQNAAYREMGVNAVYVCLRIRGKPAEAVRSAALLGIQGLNVTIPYKEEVLEAATEIDPLARKIGAANVLRLDERISAYNTDVSAALRSIREISGQDLSGLRVCLVGAGGSARAVAFGLAQEGSNVTILNRTGSRASILASEIRKKVPGSAASPLELTRENLSKCVDSSDLLINATPVGMYPRSGESIADGVRLREGLAVMDLVYNPMRTRLLAQAEDAGCPALGGLRMLVYQAAESIRIWLDREPPLDVLMRSAERAMNDYHAPP